VLLHTHLAENRDEIAQAASLFPEARSYLDIYDRFGLVGARSVFAHGVWLDDGDRSRLAGAGSSLCTCPTSNMFLGSGLFDLAAAQRAGVKIALGTDVGGGTSFSMFATMAEAYKAAQLRGQPLDPLTAFYLATLGGARALGVADRIGGLDAGKEADFLVLDLAATPLIARRLAHASTLKDKLFALAILGDDRVIAETWLAGERAHSR
jgi:guanine deaminase